MSKRFLVSVVLGVLVVPVSFLFLPHEAGASQGNWESYTWEDRYERIEERRADIENRKRAHRERIEEKRQAFEDRKRKHRERICERHKDRWHYHTPYFCDTDPEPVNEAPEVSAGDDKEITLPTDEVSLDATVTDDGLPSGTLAYQWSKESGPGDVSFSATTSEDTKATFSGEGIYVLKLQADDGDLVGMDTVEITVNAQPVATNTAPTVDAGDDQEITLPDNSVTLEGSSSDDDLPGGELFYEWTVTSGAGEVTFGSTSTPTTSASFSSSGTYVLKLTASDTELSSEDEVTITVNPPATTSLGHVVITEVYYDVDGTHGAETDNEWVEIYNGTRAPVDLTGWTVGDSSSSDALPSVTLLDGEYAIIVATSSTADFWSIATGTIIVDIGSAIGTGLGNGGDSVTLNDDSAALVDAVSWGTDTTAFDPSVVDVAEGHSISRIDKDTDTDTAADWEDRDAPNPGE